MKFFNKVYTIDKKKIIIVIIIIIIIICTITYKNIQYTTLLTPLALLTTQYYITFSFPFTHTEQTHSEREKNEKEKKERKKRKRKERNYLLHLYFRYLKMLHISIK